MRYHPFSHLGLKVVSIALGFWLWLTVTQGGQVERGLRIPIELQNLPASLQMVEPPQEAVDVRVRGGSDTLGRLAPGDLVATIDLAAAKAGRQVYQMSPDRVKAPFGVEVTQVAPSTIAIRFEIAVERQLENVTVQLRNLGAGLTARATPATVTVGVRGTETVLDRLRDDDVVAYVELDGLGPGSHGLPVRVGPAEDVAISLPEPATVRILVELDSPRR